jgi:hypothetical protein
MRKASRRTQTPKKAQRVGRTSKLSQSKSPTTKKVKKKPGPAKGAGGRPRLYSERIVLVVPRAQITELDAWRLSQPKPHPGRPAAIRHLLDFALKLHRAPTPTTTPAPERIHAEGSIKPGWPLGEPTNNTASDDNEPSGD